MTIVASVLIQTRVAATQDTLDPNPVVENVSSCMLCISKFKLRISKINEMRCLGYSIEQIPSHPCFRFLIKIWCFVDRCSNCEVYNTVSYWISVKFWAYLRNRGRKSRSKNLSLVESNTELPLQTLIIVATTLVKLISLFCLVTCGVCENGWCSGPNECTCDEGYRMDNGTCQSMFPSGLFLRL